MSFIGLVLVIALGISIVLIGVKLVPAYIEFFSVKKILTAIAKDPGFETMSPAEIRKSFERRLAIDYVTAVDSKDLEITKEDGNNVVSVEYSQKIPLAFNVSACLDFEASTSDVKSTKPIE
jgi:hypothetical protein